MSSNANINPIFLNTTSSFVIANLSTPDQVQTQVPQPTTFYEAVPMSVPIQVVQQQLPQAIPINKIHRITSLQFGDESTQRKTKTKRLSFENNTQITTKTLQKQKATQKQLHQSLKKDMYSLDDEKELIRQKSRERQRKHRKNNPPLKLDANVDNSLRKISFHIGKTPRDTFKVRFFFYFYFCKLISGYLFVVDSGNFLE
jgi:hypothetical protein